MMNKALGGAGWPDVGYGKARISYCTGNVYIPKETFDCMCGSSLLFNGHCTAPISCPAVNWAKYVLHADILHFYWLLKHSGNDQ